MSGSSSSCLYPNGTVRAIRGIGIHSFSSLMSVGCGSFHLPMPRVIFSFYDYLQRLQDYNNFSL